MVDFRCLACGGASSKPWLTACRDYYLGLGQPVNYEVCSTCSLVQQWPIPENPGDFYTQYPVHTRRSRMQQIARRVLQRQVYFRPSGDTRSQTLLDYGCGDGVYLREMAGRYKNMVGYEPGADHARSLAASLQLPVYHQHETLEAEWAGKVDTLVAHYVMEHVVDLHETFRLFSRLVKPGGLVYIAVPNIRSWEARWFGRRWHGLDAPRHISFPDATTFKRLAAEHGFGTVDVSHAIFPNTLAASVCTVLTGRYHSLLFNLLILPSWVVAAVAPSGTEVFQLRKST